MCIDDRRATAQWLRARDAQIRDHATLPLRRPTKNRRDVALAVARYSQDAADGPPERPSNHPAAQTIQF
jgi:hypothetical protein